MYQQHAQGLQPPEHVQPGSQLQPTPIGINGMVGADQQNGGGGTYANQQRQPQTAQAVRALQQHAQDAQGMAQNGHFGSHMPGELGGLGMNNPGLQGPQTAYPGQPMPMAAPDLNAFQQQQSAAMAALAQAAQNRGMRPSSGGESFSADGAIRPPAAARPSSLNLMGINPAEFPFDFRLLPYLQHVDDQRLMETMRQKDPSMVAALQAAHTRLQSGSVKPEVFAKMQQMFQHMQNAQRMGGALPPGVRPPPGLSGGGAVGLGSMPVGNSMGPGNGGQTVSSSPVSGSMMTPQQRLWAQAQQGNGGLLAGPGTGGQIDSPSPMIRPPPPHLPPPMDTQLNPPGHERRVSNGLGMLDRGENAPSNTGSMAPPAWIPGGSGTRPPEGPNQQSSSIPVPEWRAHLREDLPITSITPIPTSDPDANSNTASSGFLAPLSIAEKRDVRGWIDKDLEFAAGLKERKQMAQKRMLKWAMNEDRDTPWWSMRKGEVARPPPGRLTILWPSQKAEMRARLSHRGRTEIRL
jgi:hypothetical protein